MKMPFGRHRGVELEDLPDDYLEWLRVIDLRPGLRAAVEQEHTRRLYRETFQPSLIRLLPEEQRAAVQIVEAGRRAMAKTAHPDIGGSLTTMTLINSTCDKLKQQIGAAL
jgi:Putative quorum-sensing-regulated virulence factor